MASPRRGRWPLSLARLPSSWLRPGAEPELRAARLLRALRDHSAAGERGGGVSLASPCLAGAERLKGAFVRFEHGSPSALRVSLLGTPLCSEKWLWRAGQPAGRPSRAGEAGAPEQVLALGTHLLPRPEFPLTRGEMTRSAAASAVLQLPASPIRNGTSLFRRFEHVAS